MHKADKELSDVAARWEEIKKGTSQVKLELSCCNFEFVCCIEPWTSEMLSDASAVLSKLGCVCSIKSLSHSNAI